MADDDFSTPDSMLGVAPNRFPLDDEDFPLPRIPPETYGEPPRSLLPESLNPPGAPIPIPTDPLPSGAFKPPFFQDVFNPLGPGGLPFQQFPPPPSGGGPNWPDIVGLIIGSAIFAGGLYAAGDYIYHRSDEISPPPPPPPPMPIPNLIPIPVEGPYSLPDVQEDHTSLQPYSPLPTQLSTAPSFTDVSSAIIGGISEISDGVL